MVKHESVSKAEQGVFLTIANPHGKSGNLVRLLSVLSCINVNDWLAAAGEAPGAGIIVVRRFALVIPQPVA
jgi:hypothetical protein